MVNDIHDVRLLRNFITGINSILYIYLVNLKALGNEQISFLLIRVTLLMFHNEEYTNDRNICKGIWKNDIRDICWPCSKSFKCV